MTLYSEFAILAPVPQEHITSGQDIAAKEGFVAFGSRKWELFRKIDGQREGKLVPVLIYPSHEDITAKTNFVVSWVGLYIGSEKSNNGTHPQGMKHRPPTTAQYESDNKGYWAVFWHVDKLLELPAAQRLLISDLQTVKNCCRKNAPPRGPELVAIPSTIEFPE